MLLVEMTRGVGWVVQESDLEGRRGEHRQTSDRRAPHSSHLSPIHFSPPCCIAPQAKDLGLPLTQENSTTCL